MESVIVRKTTRILALSKPDIPYEKSIVVNKTIKNT